MSRPMWLWTGRGAVPGHEAKADVGPEEAAILAAIEEWRWVSGRDEDLPAFVFSAIQRLRP